MKICIDIHNFSKTKPATRICSIKFSAFYIEGLASASMLRSCIFINKKHIIIYIFYIIVAYYYIYDKKFFIFATTNAIYWPSFSNNYVAGVAAKLTQKVYFHSAPDDWEWHPLELAERAPRLAVDDGPETLRALWQVVHDVQRRRQDLFSTKFQLLRDFRYSLECVVF